MCQGLLPIYHWLYLLMTSWLVTPPDSKKGENPTIVTSLSCCNHNVKVKTYDSCQIKWDGASLSGAIFIRLLTSRIFFSLVDRRFQRRDRHRRRKRHRRCWRRRWRGRRQHVWRRRGQKLLLLDQLFLPLRLRNRFFRHQSGRSRLKRVKGSYLAQLWKIKLCQSFICFILRRVFITRNFF